MWDIIRAFILVGFLLGAGFLVATKIYMGSISCFSSEIKGLKGERKEALCSCFHKPSRFEGLKIVVCEIKEMGQ